MTKLLVFIYLFVYVSVIDKILYVKSNRLVNKADDEKRDHLSKYVVSIRYIPLKTHGFGEDHICGGAIINKRTVLTAAHCLHIPKNGRMDKNNIELVAGTSKRLEYTKHTQIRYVRDIIIHELYNRTTQYNDISLLKLLESFDLDKKYVATLPLATKKYEIGDECTTLGWGRLYENGPWPNEISNSSITILPRLECLNNIIHVRSSTICAISGNAGKEICLGDSGSPMICHGVLTGIVSQGFGCNSMLPHMYTNVYYFKDWISKNNAICPPKTIPLKFIVIILTFNYFCCSA